MSDKVLAADEENTEGISHASIPLTTSYLKQRLGERVLTQITKYSFFFTLSKHLNGYDFFTNPYLIYSYKWRV